MSFSTRTWGHGWRSLVGGALGALSLGLATAVDAPENPATAAPPRLLCLGDSITAGGQNFSSYRPALAAKLAAAHLAVEFVGTRAGDPPHEGYGGKSVEELVGLGPDHFAPLRADFVLLHAGHNHSAEESPIPGIIAATETLIGFLRAAQPSVTVLLAQVIPSGKLPKYAYLPELNRELGRLAARLDRPGQRVVLVDQAGGFDWRTDTIADHVHPNAAGAARMADRWFAALAPLLQAGPAEVRGAGASSSVGAVATEFHVRQGLPNVAAKIAAGEPVRVAFFGGSITAAAGWRVGLLAWLRARYPRVQFTEIFAAVSGTGSDYGAPRVGRDVLRHRPDLIFVEFAVNDGTGSPGVEAQMEGIVRQAWAADARTDLCFLYTVSAPMLPELRAGKYASSARSMEKVAEYYGIPSINLGIEVARRIAAGTMVMAAPATLAVDAAGRDANGRLVFTNDQTHPTAAGHRVYTERLQRILPEFLRAGAAAPHALPARRVADDWQRARLVLVTEASRDAQWKLVPPDDPHVTTQVGPHLVPPVWVSLEAGARVEFRFKGTALGLVGLKGPDNGLFRVTVDDLPPRTGTLFDRFSTPGRFYLARWYFSRALPDREHRVCLELLPDQIDKAKVMREAGTPIDDATAYVPHRMYLAGFLIVGELVGQPTADTFGPVPSAGRAVPPPRN